MAAGLGETTNPRELIPGEPELIAGDLRDLVAGIQQIGTTGDGLAGIAPAQWSGAAADAFREAFGAEPPKWIETAALLGQGGQALADFGDALTWAQSEAQRAIEMYTEAQAASRAAAAQYDAQAAQAQAVGQALAPFQDPGEALAREAQSVLDFARAHVSQIGDSVAAAFGFEPDGDGGYRKELGEKSHEPGRRKGFEWGSQSDGMLSDRIDETLEALGFDLSDETFSASASGELLGGSLDGSFGAGVLSGSGKLEGSLFGASAGVSGSVNALGVTAAANAEAWLAKGSAEGQVKLGEHAGASGHAEASVGARAEAEGSASLTGVRGSLGGSAGVRAGVAASAEGAGLSAGVHGGFSAGVGAHADGQIGMGDDGKFHLSASLGLTLGIGADVGFDIAIDPEEVVDTVTDVADDVADIATDVGHGLANAADAVADFLF
ncbi:putative T7SS-secreted protein [Amycolatopsis thermoflava]|uniref:putative T7SS-secreted protein n=1 Tax=Amycolatopsis thermoflava TaxID=84480 RepID=UPI003D74D87E